MTTSNLPPSTIGGAAIATGVAGVLALAFIILFFTVGQPFGTLNDIFIGLAAILSGVVAWMSYPAHHAQSPVLSQVALIAAWVGALVVAVGSALVISRVTGWFLAGLYMTAGNALIGLWLLGLNYSAQQGNSWPHGLAVFGLVAGVVMAVGLVAVPGILGHVDAQEAAPWIVNVGYVGGLGWAILYPVWCIGLGRALLLR